MKNCIKKIRRDLFCFGIILPFFVLILVLSQLFLSGCGIKYPQARNLDDFHSPRLIDPNNTPFKMTKSVTDPNNWTIGPRLKNRIVLEKPCRVNYRKIEFLFGKIAVVTGTLPNGKEYPIWIDSGFTGAEIVLNDLIVKENKLEIFVCNCNADSQEMSLVEKRRNSDLCFLPQLKIDELIIKEPLCIFFPWHQEFQLAGLPLWQNRSVLFGLSMMARFRYLYFDNPKMQLEFSHKQSFHPSKPEEWSSYPFKLKKIDDKQMIMLDIPIAGQTGDIYFDTGGTITIVKPAMWKRIQKATTATTPRKSKFLSYQLGFLPCQRSVVKKLSVGDLLIKNAEIVIVPDDTPYLSKGVDGYISLGTLKDTSVVLDFEHKLLWIKTKQVKNKLK